MMITLFSPLPSHVLPYAKQLRIASFASSSGVSYCLPCSYRPAVTNANRSGTERMILGISHWRLTIKRYTGTKHPLRNEFRKQRLLRQTCVQGYTPVYTGMFVSSSAF